MFILKGEKVEEFRAEKVAMFPMRSIYAAYLNTDRKTWTLCRHNSSEKNVDGMNLVYIYREIQEIDGSMVVEYYERAELLGDELTYDDVKMWMQSLGYNTEW